MQAGSLNVRSATFSGSFGLAGAYPRKVSPPSGFGWSPTWGVIEIAPGVFTTTLDVRRDLMVATAATRYVALSDGSNADNGSTWALAHKSLWDGLNDAFTAGLAVTIYVEGSADPLNPTVYDYDNAWRVALAVDANIIVVSDRTTLAPGYAISSTYMAPGGAYLGTWGLGPTEAAVYEAALAAAPAMVIDATVTNATTGTHQRLTLQASAAAVQATPGSYYWAGGVLYVRTADSRAPDASLRALRAGVVNGHINTATVDCYIEGLSFEGGSGAGTSRALYIQAMTSATIVNCKATHSSGEGLSLSSSTVSADHTLHFINCQALDCDGDGFQYTATGNAAVVRALEWNCVSKVSSGAGTDQGSSAHRTAGNTSVSMIRIGCLFASNKTEGFADVGGTTTWALGCRFESEAIGAYVGDTGTGWLHGCTFNGCTTDLDPFDAGATIYTADCHYTTTAGSGTVGKYHP